MDPRPTILIVLPAKQLTLDADRKGCGGIYKAALSQVQALLSQGVHVTVLTASLPFAKEAGDLGAKTFFHPAWHSSILPLVSPACWQQARQILQDKPVAALHHSGRSWSWAKALFGRIPNVGVLHTGAIRRTRHFTYQLALSSANLRQLQADPANRKYKIRHIKNGLLTAVAVPQEAKPPAPPSAPLRLGYLGRVCHDKGMDILLRAAAILKHREIPVSLAIVGGEAGEYAELARQLAVDSFTKFQTWTDDPAAFYASIDIFCVPSRHEPFGLVVIEAMSRSLPVIASASDGPLDIIEDGVSGIIFPIDSPGELAKAVEHLFHNPAVRTRLGENAARRISNDFSPEAVGHSILSALKSLLPAETLLQP